MVSLLVMICCGQGKYLSSIPLRGPAWSAQRSDWLVAMVSEVVTKVGTTELLVVVIGVHC